MKRPAFQFYPADWRNDAALKLCSMGARGLWIEMICIMHMAEPYGHLCAAGNMLTAKDLAKLAGESLRDVERWLDELLRYGVCSKADNGSIYSRRMVRDEALRNTRAEGGEAGKSFGHLGAKHGKKGGRPKKETGDKKPPLKPAPSSSSSSSSSEDQKPIGRQADRFADFWLAYPKKVGRQACESKWKTKNLNALADRIIADVKARAASHQPWRDGFILNPETYLNGARWEDDILTPAEANGFPAAAAAFEVAR